MIHPPAARLPFAARVYLAGISIAILVLIALHFSIQTWSQQQAQQWLAAWEKEYGGHVGEVRLHMLRGALSIRDVQWQSKASKDGGEGIEFYAPFVLLRGNLSTLMQQVEIREVTLQGAKLVLSKTFFQQFLQQDRPLEAWLPWANLLRSIRLVDGKDLDFTVRETHANGGFLAPFHITHADIFSAPKQQEWHVTGDLWGGIMNIQQQSNVVHTTFSGLNALAASQYLGLSELDGEVSGEGNWINSSKRQEISGYIQWQGEKGRSDAYQTIDGENSISEGKLTFHGFSDEEGWQGDVDALNWPLHIFSVSAPVFNQRTLREAYLQGMVHVQSRKQGWQAHLQAGSMHHLNYQSQSSADWYIQQLELKEALLSWPQRNLSIEAIDMVKGRWGIDSSVKNTVGKSSEKSPAWEITLPKVQFSSMQLGDVAKNIWLNDVQGKASLLKGKIQVRAETSSDVTGVWKLQAQGGISRKQDATDFNLSLKLQVDGAPLRYFRDVLPQVLTQASSLNGDVDLQLSGAWNKQGWQLQGDASGTNLMWNRGAWLWQAKDVQVNGISFHSFQVPHIKGIKVKAWSGQTSLKPWSHTVRVNAPNHILPPFTLDGWQLEHVTFENGRFSLGQAESVWLEADIISLNDVREGKNIAMKLQGKLAKGALIFDGVWFPWGQYPWLTFEASLKNALPFRAASWLKNSGLPTFNQGRISVDIKVNHADQLPEKYQGMMNLTLSYGQLQGGVFSNQALSDFTAYTAHALFDRISRNGNIRLQVPLQGNWVNKPFDGQVLGQALLAALADKANEVAEEDQKETIFTLPNIRLHDTLEGRSDKLKYNERVRLRKVLHLLQADKAWRIELIPELGQSQLDESLRQRVRQTQQQIETFLVDRGVSPSRIFPIWPEQSSRQGESTGILIQAVK